MAKSYAELEAKLRSPKSEDKPADQADKPNDLTIEPAKPEAPAEAEANPITTAFESFAKHYEDTKGQPAEDQIAEIVKLGRPAEHRRELPCWPVGPVSTRIPTGPCDSGRPRHLRRGIGLGFQVPDRRRDRQLQYPRHELEHRQTRRRMARGEIQGGASVRRLVRRVHAGHRSRRRVPIQVGNGRRHEDRPIPD